MSHLDSTRRGSVPVSKLVAFACAFVIAGLALTGAWLLIGTRAPADRLAWAEPLRLRANDLEREITSADRLLRLYIIQGKASDAERFERQRADAGTALEAFTSAARDADAETRDAAAGLADAVRKWLDLADTWFRAARAESVDATRLAVMARIGPDDPLENMVTQRRAVRNVVDRAVAARDADATEAISARSARVAMGLTLVGLAAVGAVAFAWIASRSGGGGGHGIEVGTVRAVLDQLPDAVAIFGEHGEIIASNLAAARAVESTDGVSGRLALFGADGSPVADTESPVARALAGLHVMESELYTARGDGSLAPVEVQAEPILFDGRASAAVVVMRDRAERRRYEEELSQLADQKAAAEINCADIGRRLRAVEAELVETRGRAERAEGDVASARHDAEAAAARLAKLTTNAAVGIAVFRGHEMQLVEANEQGLAMLGERRREREVRGFALEELVPGADAAGLLDLFRKVAASGETYSSAEYLAQGLRHGNAYWRFALVPSAAGEASDEAELLLVGIDTTEDVERRAAGGKAHGDWTIEDVLLAIANDLRTPILSIQGMVELFRQKYAEAVPDVTALHYLELTQRNADQIATLIDDLVSLSSLGHEELKVAEIPLAAAIEEAWRASARHGTELRVAGPLPTVRADRAKLMRAFRDIFDAAARRKRAGDGAWIHVRVHDVGGRWEIEMSDNGRPLEEGESERLFGPLAKHNVAAATGGEPTLVAGGLGLAAMRRIAELHGGDASVEGDAEGGATYRLTIAKELPV
jgi:PAS domain S-box-containing protein